MKIACLLLLATLFGAQEHYELALDSFREQEIDTAFIHYLKALDELNVQKAPKMCPEEKKLFAAALDTYLEGAGSDPVRVARQLLDTYGDADPSWLHLQFVLSAAYANLGEFGAFFSRFYAAYPFMKEHFLAKKTRGILYLRLASRTPDVQAKNSYTQEAFCAFTEALAKNPKDASVYKVLIFLAKDEKNRPLVRSYLQKMVHASARIARGDIERYVHEACGMGEMELAQQIIDLARMQYTFSRALIAAQEYVNQCNRG